MANLTWREIRDELNRLSEDRLDDNATVYLKGEDEWMPVMDMGITEEDDVLDKGHSYLSVDF